MSYDTVLERIIELGLEGPTGTGWDGNTPFRCPAHDDNSPSASVKEGDDGKVLLHCHAGCDVNDIVDALGLKLGDLFSNDEPQVVAEYVYTDEWGSPLIMVQRTEPGPDGKKKGFSQFRWDLQGLRWVPGLRDTERPLYYLPGVLANERVWIVEGEKDADRLNEVLPSGEAATTTLGGAGKWRDEWTHVLSHKYVTIVADNDEPGIKHAERIRDAVPHARILYPARGKDVSDHLDAGLGPDDLLEQPPAERRTLRLKPIDFENIPPPRALLYEPFIYERALTWLWGPSGHGKSMVLDKAMADLSRQGVASLLYEWEEGYQEGDRLRRLGADLTRVHVFNMTDSDEPVDLGTEWLVDEMIAAVQQTGARLVVINPFVLAGGSPSGTDPDVWNEAPRRARETFKRIIEETGAAVVVIDHQDDPEKERAHGGRSKKWLADIYLRVTRDGDEYRPGEPYHIKIDNLKQAREWLPTIRATVMGQHRQGPLWIQWHYAQDVGAVQDEGPSGGEGSDPAVLEPGSPGRGPAAPAPVEQGDESAPPAESVAPPAPLPLKDRIALQLLKDELGATDAHDVGTEQVW